MFRATQSQNLPKFVDQMLNRFNTEAKGQGEMVGAFGGSLERVEVAIDPTLRRRRSRRMPVHAGTSLRSTWY